MANNFQIIISAVDRATAVVQKVNRSIAQATRPIADMRSAMAGLAKETGLDRVGQSMVDVGRAAADVGGKVASIVAPMAAIAGVSSVAGIAALATEWGRLGAEIGRTSATIGISAEQLQSIQGAARLAGVSSDGMANSLKALGDTMEDALYGRNQLALGVFSQLGIALHRTASGGMDASRAFGDLADTIQRTASPQVQSVIARTFGLEEALPLLRLGRKGLQEYQTAAERAGAVMSGPAVAAAGQFQRSLTYLHLATDGVRNAIGEKLLPILSPLVDQVAAWTVENRQLIATNVAGFVQGVADAVKTIDWKAVGEGARDFGKAALWVVDALGGWRNAAIGVAVAMNANLLAGVLRLGTALVSFGTAVVPVVVRALAVLGEAVIMPALATGFANLGLFTSGLAGMAAGIPVVSTALTALGDVFLGVGAAIEATPVGWFLTAVAAIGAAAYGIYENWAPIRAWFGRLWDGIATQFQGSIDILMGIVTLDGARIVKGIHEEWDGLKAYFQAVWDGVVCVFEWAWGKIEPIVNGAINGAKAVGRFVGLTGPDDQSPAVAPSRPASSAPGRVPVVALAPGVLVGPRTAGLPASATLPASAAQSAAAPIIPAVSQASGPPVATPYTPLSAASSAAAQANATPNAQAQVGQGQAPPPAQVQLTVTFENAPQGLKTQTTASPGVVVDVRLDQSMPVFTPR